MLVSHRELLLYMHACIVQCNMYFFPNASKMHCIKDFINLKSSIKIFDSFFCLIIQDWLNSVSASSYDISKRNVGLFPPLLYGIKLVGSSGLEPPTSRLSGVRSNRLSYEPSYLFKLPPQVAPAYQRGTPLLSSVTLRK